MNKCQSTDEQAEKSRSSRNEHWNVEHHEEHGNSQVPFTGMLVLFPTLKALPQRKAPRTSRSAPTRLVTTQSNDHTNSLSDQTRSLTLLSEMKLAHCQLTAAFKMGQ